MSKDMIDRTNLNRILSASSHLKYICFTAASGYGKTTAANSYLSSIDVCVIWLTFTPLDNYSSHLWANIISSVRTKNTDLADHLEVIGFPEDLSSIHILSRILEYHLKGQRYVFVLDDFHLITESHIKSFFKDIIFTDIDNVSVYILSQEKVGFIDEQTKNALILTKVDLAFSVEEINLYLAQLNVHLSDDILYDIHAKTRGWPFAVHLVAMSLKKHPAMADHSYLFSDQLIFETIEREIFSHFSKPEQAFLLELSLLDFYPKKLIEDIFPPSGPINLNHLSKNVSFISYNRHVNAYHFDRLFRDFLRSKNFLLNHRRKTEIYQAAGNWFFKYGLMLDALNCFRKITDYDKMADLIFHLVRTPVSKDYALMLLDIMSEFPEEYLTLKPMLRAVRGVFGMLSGDPRKSILICKENLSVWKSSPDSTSIRQALGENFAVMAFAYMYLGNVDFAKYFKLADQYLDGASFIYGKTQMFLFNGNPITLQDGRKGALERWVSALEQTAPILDKLFTFGMSGIDSLARAAAFYYQNNLKAAEESVQKSLSQSSEKNQLDIICQSYYFLIRIAVGRGDFSAASEYLSTLNSYRTHKAPPMFNIIDIASSWYHVALGFESYVPNWITNNKKFASDTYTQAYGVERIIKALCLLNTKKYTELIAYQLSSKEIYVRYNRYIYQIYMYVILSAAYYKTNKVEESIQAFYDAYKMSRQNNMIQPFIELRNDSRTLINNMIKYKKKSKAFSTPIRNILEQMDGSWLEKLQKRAIIWTKMANSVRNQFIAQNQIPDDTEIVFSKNEYQVLECICNGLTREETAEFMNLSVNTIKTIISMIYSKLGAQNSAHAVRIAMQKGLIS